MSEPRPLHRLFGLSWIDFFRDTPVAVETELDLSLKQQFIDLVLIRKAPGPLPRPLPDGFEDLARHNLVTFKSHQEALDAWRRITQASDASVVDVCTAPQKAFLEFLDQVAPGRRRPQKSRYDPRLVYQFDVAHGDDHDRSH